LTGQPFSTMHLSGPSIKSSTERNNEKGNERVEMKAHGICSVASPVRRETGIGHSRQPIL
jgi:hypothetical protein